MEIENSLCFSRAVGHMEVKSSLGNERGTGIERI